MGILSDQDIIDQLLKNKISIEPFHENHLTPNGYDLSINRYKAIVYEEVEYEKPKVILQKIRDLEKEIIVCLKDLNVMELD